MNHHAKQEPERGRAASISASVWYSKQTLLYEYGIHLSNPDYKVSTSL